MSLLMTITKAAYYLTHARHKLTLAVIVRKTFYHPHFKDGEVETWIKAFSPGPQAMGPIASKLLDCNYITWQLLALMFIIITTGHSFQQ